MPTTFAQTIDGNEILAKRSQCDYAGNDIQTTYATKAEVTTGLAGKENTISDLATIRSGAQAGSTAVQPGDLATVATTGAYSDLSGTPTIPSGTQLVPASTSADADKVLTVDAQGTPGWASPSSGGSVTDVEVNGTSVVNASGVAEVTVPSGAQLVPAATSADADKVLTVDSLGVPGWAVVPAQSTGLFQAEYGTTAYNEVRDAVLANKIVYCYVNGRMAFLAYIASNNYEFQYYRSNSWPQGMDSVFIYKVSRNGWETTERTVKAGNISYPVTAVNVNGSSAMTGTVANITIPAAPTVDQTYDASSTNAQSGTAVAEAIAAVSLGDVNNVLQVNALPATTEAHTLYLIPET